MWSPVPSRRRGWCGRWCGRSGSSCRIRSSRCSRSRRTRRCPRRCRWWSACWCGAGSVAGVAAVAMLAFAVALVPRALAGPDPDARGPRLVVMTSNLYLGQADARAVLRIAREHDVDVWSLQELRPRLMTKLDRAGADELFPGRVLDPREGASGSGVLSRTPLVAIDTSPNRKGHAEPEVALRVRGRAARAAEGRASLPRRSTRPRRRSGRTRSPRCRARTAAATSRSSRATSTPRSTTRSCATCSTAATSTPPTPSARASSGPGRRSAAPARCR